MTPVGRGVLAALALALGAGALVEGNPSVDALSAEARIAPMELARRIMNRDRRLLVVDLRSASEYEDYHLPRARHAPLPELGALEVPPEAVVVLYGEDPAELAEARARVLARGASEVRILEGGAAGWIGEVLNPVLPSDAGEEERKAFLEAGQVSRYFGGVPRIVPRDELPPVGSVPEMVEKMRLRGCRGG